MDAITEMLADAATENKIRQEQVESFGRLMAGFSHDMKNHLGIIRESNGLMDDLLSMGVMAEDDPTLARLKKSIAAIERRVVMAANLYHHLSGLAHRPDKPFSSFQVNDLIVEECTFLERYSRLKQVEMTLEPGEGVAALYNDPALLQHVFYRLYMVCLEQLDAGQGLVILTSQDGGYAVITFRLVGISQVSIESLSDTQVPAAVDKLKGTLAMGGNTDEYADIVLKVPSLSDVKGM